MEKLRAAWNLNFSTKILVPMVTLMVLLLALTVWTVNQGINRQFRADAGRTLATADAVFGNSENIHTKNLLLRFHNLCDEPRYKALLQSGDLPTQVHGIRDLPAEQGVEVVLFTSPKGQLLASAKQDLLLLSLSEFEKNSALAVKQALAGEETVDTIRVGEHFFHVISVPVSGISGEPIGALTFGAEIGEAVAHEFSLVTHSQIAFLADGHVLTSTLSGPGLDSQFARLYSAGLASARASTDPQEVLVGDEHYFCAAGKFAALSGEGQLGYLLLSSYESPLRALQSTQQQLLLVSLVGIVLGTAVIWFLVRKATAPLRQLRDSAEAVGRGDFSRHVEVTSKDECGELANVFNRMTENVKRSREELEKTVDSLKSTQAQLVQSEKLSGIGEFVAGVAHELNNPLTSVMGFSELLAQSNTDPAHRRPLELIHKSAVRCQKIVQSLLSFARKHQPERKLSNANTLVENAVDFLSYQLRTSNIELITRLDPRLPNTMLDPHQMQQVFLNIINNGRQAIEAHRPKGRIIVTTQASADHLRVTFQDDGPGIAEENLAKLFDPFFTTKEVGKGTGLGLSLCYGIVKEHGGQISVRSKLGEGATFVIELPLASVAEEPAPAPEPAPATLPARVSGAGKKVLVIDDEEPILEMVRAALSAEGFQVDVARDGEAALRRVSQTPYDLALCDWKMPGLSGEQVYERVRASNPALSERMIFITGDVISDRIQKFLCERNKVCLSKPFSLGEFRSAIDKALGGS
jgi:two-component system, NtrC family, sensor kinase